MFDGIYFDSFFYRLFNTTINSVKLKFIRFLFEYYHILKRIENMNYNRDLEDSVLEHISEFKTIKITR